MDRSLLVSKYRRRTFYFLAVLICILLGSARFLALPRLSKEETSSVSTITGNILDNLLAAAIVSIAVTTLILWLMPPTGGTAVMEVVEPVRIKETLQEALDQ